MEKEKTCQEQRQVDWSTLSQHFPFPAVIKKQLCYNQIFFERNHFPFSIMLHYQIAFAKTHKTGGSTLQNILFRAKDGSWILTSPPIGLETWEVWHLQFRRRVGCIPFKSLFIIPWSGEPYPEAGVQYFNSEIALYKDFLTK